MQYNQDKNFLMHVQFKNEDIVEEDDGSNIALSLELNSSLV